VKCQQQRKKHGKGCKAGERKIDKNRHNRHSTQSESKPGRRW
jgi:hypothetical protein